jgi:phosphatidylethanolamine/phosphatidyl-N-methylethanolamine N-methyltransferase
VPRNTGKFYNSFSIFYPLVDIFLKPQKRTLIKEVNVLAPGNVLEIGVGTGKHLPLYKNHTITGIDISEAMLKQASHYKTDRIELLLMNGEKLDFKDGQFDYVVLSHVIAVAENPEKLMEEVYRVVKENGRVLILNHFTPRNWLKYLDKAFHSLSSLFHFRSLFYADSIKALKKFSLIKEVSFGRLSYFKLLIYSKP